MTDKPLAERLRETAKSLTRFDAWKEEDLAALCYEAADALPEPTVEHLAAVLRYCGVKNPVPTAMSIWAKTPVAIEYERPPEAP